MKYLVLGILMTMIVFSHEEMISIDISNVTGTLDLLLNATDGTIRIIVHENPMDVAPILSDNVISFLVLITTATITIVLTLGTVLFVKWILLNRKKFFVEEPPKRKIGMISSVGFRMGMDEYFMLRSSGNGDGDKHGNDPDMSDSEHMDNDNDFDSDDDLGISHL
ncbi:unnamed protein product [Caenorhabditis sp. 36 PRJEB53466]|nr:unnamed protein product [Caenorhabditis sp. 36 PRJEB53466]